MGLTPQTFWSLSLTEWRAAFAGFLERNGFPVCAPLSRAGLEALMNRYPDEFSRHDPVCPGHQ